jgi:NADH:ubiquinone oxidoreductase subunit 3 (subunit A)
LIIEATLAFAIIVVAASIVYLLGRRAAPKPGQTDAERSQYSCGEKITFSKLRVNVALYKYLIYFVILDSSVLLLAYGAFMGVGINVPLILLYLFMLLAAGLLLLDGGRRND